MNKKVGRPQNIPDEHIIVLDATLARTKVQVDSDRRALINYLIGVRGRATVAEINGHFGYDIRAAISSLSRNGWLKIIEKEKQ